jgi:hypothetical protein
MTSVTSVAFFSRAAAMAAAPDAPMALSVTHATVMTDAGTHVHRNHTRSTTSQSCKLGSREVRTARTTVGAATPTVQQRLKWHWHGWANTETRSGVRSHLSGNTAKH